MRYYLFDFDGTICDSKEGILNAAEYALKKMNIENKLTRSEMEPVFIGPPLTQSLPYYTGDDTETVAQAIKHFREYYNKYGTYENTIFGGVREMLDTLSKRGAHFYIASSKPTKFIKLILNKHGISAYFEKIFSPDLDEDHLTKYDIIMLAKNEINSSEPTPVICMVGDRKYDIDAAHKAGIPCIGVSWGSAANGELEDHHADYIANSPNEILNIDLQIMQSQEHK